MAKVIAVAGTKGGTGKSTLSHLIAHGAGSLPKPIPAIVVTTDEDDDGCVRNLGRYAASWIAWWLKRPSSTAALT